MSVERICRKDDESLYQPQIHSKNIKLLYSIKQETGIPMTVLVDRAVRELVESYDAEFDLQEELVDDMTLAETWEDICEIRKLLNQLDYLKYLGELEKIKSHE
jgi:hypothetical protein